MGTTADILVARADGAHLTDHQADHHDSAAAAREHVLRRLITESNHSDENAMENALRMDTRLTEQKRALLTLYRSYIAANSYGTVNDSSDVDFVGYA